MLKRLTVSGPLHGGQGMAALRQGFWGMMQGLVLPAMILVMLTVFGSGYIQADYEGGGLAEVDPGAILDQQRQREANTPEKKLERIQAYFLKEMFLKHMFNPESTTILSEEDQSGFVSPMERGVVYSMMMDNFAQTLAEQDILNFKKLYLRQTLSSASDKKGVE